MLTRRKALTGAVATTAVAAAIAAPAVARASQRRDAAVGLVERWMADRKVPGVALAILEDGRPTLARGLGVRNLDTGDAMTPTTLVRVGSVSKVFAALPALRLMDQGKLDLDAPISRYAPEFKVDDRITTRLALGMAGGMIDYVSDRPDRGDDSIRAYVAEMTPAWRQFEPNAVFSYSNPGYSAAALAVERAGGQSFLVQAEETLRALGLEQTTYDIGRVLSRAHTAAHENSPQGVRLRTADVWAGIRHDAPESAVWMSAEDAGSWMAWLIAGPGAGGAISPRAFELMQRPVSGIPALGQRYALGLHVDRRGGEPLIGHGGGFAGYNALYEVAPDKGVGVAVFANLDGVPRQYALVESVMAELSAVSTNETDSGFLLTEGFGLIAVT